MYRTKPKSFDMAKSILPSKARKAARESKRALHQQNRARIHTTLSQYRGPAADVCELYDDEDNDLFFNPDPHKHAGYDTIVSDRREADKLNHFVRWAKEITKGMTERQAHDYMAALVPEGLIGDHAMTHLYMFQQNPYKYSFFQPYTGQMSPFRQHIEDVNQQITQAVGDIVDDAKALAKLNHNLSHFYRMRNASAERAWLRRQWSMWQLCGPKPTPEVFEPWTPDNYIKMLQRQVHFYFDYGRDGNHTMKPRVLTKFIDEYFKLNLSL